MRAEDAVLRRLLLYMHTVRHLHWRQVVYRPVRAVQRHLPSRPPAVAPPVVTRETWLRLRELATQTSAEEVHAAIERAERVRRGEFQFLTRTEHLADVDWGRQYHNALWTYNLHYFDYARDLALAWSQTRDAGFADRFAELVGGWIRGTERGGGAGWDAYPTAVRTVNWIQSAALLEEALDRGFMQRLEASVYRQLLHLEQRIEWHLLGNHVLKNMHALAVGGLVFEDAAARRWRDKATPLLWDQLAEQVLPDGGHCERSPMYHAIVLADVLELIQLAQATGRLVPAAVLERARAMWDALGKLVRADGTLHLLNDTADGVAPAPRRLTALAEAVLRASPPPPPDGAWALESSGFFGFVDAGSRDSIVIDAGEPGPSFQPAHAHCGLLSFEFDAGGRPLVVDSGVRGYDGDGLREYVRSTRAHNTVMIGELEQSEVWGTFRIARRASLVYRGHVYDREVYRFEGAYRPYHDAGATHHRVIQRERGECSVTDVVEGAESARLRSFLHLHPDTRVSRLGDHFALQQPGLHFALEVFGADRVRVIEGDAAEPQGFYCPAFGVALPAPVIEAEVVSNRGRPFGFRLRRAAHAPAV